MNLILFDIDGTLVLTGGAGLEAMRVAFSSLVGRDVVLPEIGLHGLTDRAIVEEIFPQFGLANTPDTWQRYLAAYAGHLPHSLRTRQGKALAGAVQLVERLSGQERVAVGLLTGNVREAARLKLEFFGMWPHFTFGGYGNDRLLREDVARDALDDWRRVSGRPLEGATAWVIGDTPADIRCARAIHARVVAVATGTYTMGELAAHRPDYVLADLTDTSWLADLA